MDNKRFASDIVNRVKMSEVFYRFGFKPNRIGFISCPFHKEKTASMKAYKHDTRFHCFGCGRTGSVIDFVMLLNSLTFTETMTQLNHDFGLGLPIGERVSLRQKREIERTQRERLERRQAEEQERQEIEDAYWTIFEEWKRLDDNRRNYRPKSINEELHPLYIEALQRIDYQQYLLDIAENERW